MPRSRGSSTNYAFMRFIGHIVSLVYRLGSVIRFFHSLSHVARGWYRWLKGCEVVRSVAPSEEDILNASAVRMARMIRSREWRSELVVRTCIARIKQVQPLINAVVDDCYQEAVERAREIDSLLDRGAESLPPSLSPELCPLLGVPCSVKMSIFVSGRLNDVGVSHRRGRVSARDAAVVARLRRAGAIPLAVTNTSEFCLFWDSCNKIHGTTNNPYNFEHTSGGSSSGEGALVSSQGTPFGIGTDGGGSIRMPAFFTGVYGHKCSPGLVSNDGQFPHIDDVRISITTGPLCRYAEDIGPVMRAIAETPFPDWRQVDASKLGIHYVLDPHITLSSALDPAITRATLQLVDSLSKHGSECREYENKLFQWSLPIWTATNLIHGDPSIDKQLLNNDPNYEPINFGCELFKCLFGVSEFSLFTTLLALAQRRTKSNANEGFNRKLYGTGQRLKEELEALLGDNGVLLFPSHPTTAPRHNMVQVMPTNFSYTALFNATRMPATQVPLGLAPDGLPVGVQLVAKEGNDHLTIALAEYIHRITQVGWTPAPT